VKDIRLRRPPHADRLFDATQPLQQEERQTATAASNVLLFDNRTSPVGRGNANHRMGMTLNGGIDTDITKLLSGL
jgi:hypothetical protein